MNSSHIMPIRRPHNPPIINPHLESSKKTRVVKSSLGTKEKLIGIGILLILSYVFVKAFS